MSDVSPGAGRPPHRRHGRCEPAAGVLRRRALRQFVEHTGCNVTRRTWTDMLAQELVLL
ncbi:MULTISPECIES: hypothetical protein [Micromonospora]|uniref:hypothetical protein n=1 Tax=Micromonospora TaxID=1873 RepID=UPI000B0A8EC2|nr:MULTISPECIES: hypothetical protein [Micromonospora]MCK1805151.1 hypothetical protein [Micromonospora sp. R42106]MCK1830549.1 hypothetical protein [Micromonospora sp. R42003]MCK1842181.1 hypothetical protein [Micromonospora sp. R42004]MCM1015439.1 hypothetical protein [Micromonospora sp. XM-20-01]WDQ00837.1 hypothetical protein PVK74_03345 [Micromonospora chalcea]